MSTQTVYQCTNPACEAEFIQHGDLKRHQKLAKSCRWWVAHLQEAQINQANATTVVPGSIHDLTAAHFDTENDAPYGEDGDDPMEDDSDEDGSVEEVSDGEGLDASEGSHAQDGSEEQDEASLPEEEQDEDDDEAEIEARNDLIRDYINAHEDDADVFFIDRPDVAIGEQGPGPSTMRSRLGQMIGARARYLDDDGDEGENDDIVLEHPTAGEEIRTADGLYQRWTALFGDQQQEENGMDVDNGALPDLAERDLYRPFASRIDWEIARWMVTENIGHGSFNRLLEIDGVRTYILLALF